MASVLGDTTCSIHAERQSAARCPSCRKFYCRECITEHEGRLTCSTCLAVAQTPELPVERDRRIQLMPIVQVIVAVLVCWLVLYLTGRTLGDIPDEFHDGAIWE